jgi:mannan endo-1,4-beta-mannosidase
MAALSLPWAAAARGQFYRYEAEEGQFFGTRFSNDVSGYSGSGYVTSFNGQQNTPPTEDYFQLNVDVPAGLYEMWVGYRSEHGEKGYFYRVDDVSGSGMFDHSNTFSVDRAGLFTLAEGVNTLEIRENWGFYDIDYLEFRPYEPSALLPVSAQLSDPQADRRTQMLMNYLVSQYGQKTLSGLQHNASDNLSFPVQSYLNQSGGVVPAIRASDFIDYSPSRVAFGENPQNESEQTIAWAQQTGGVVTMMWHWNAPANLTNDQCGNNCGPNDYPWWRGFYTPGTSFDLPGALADPGGDDYQLLLSDIDAIGDQLQKFEDAGVPVIWRPLHEARGGWFWWGAHGAETFKDLWRLMYDRLTNERDLHNLIWEFTSIGVDGDHDDWYPGDDVVDMVGLDIYTTPTDEMSGQWTDALDFYNGRKMIALSETDTLVDPDVMSQWGTEWAYAAPWAWDYVQSEYAKHGYNSGQVAAILQQFLNHEDVVTLDELPILPWSQLAPALPGDYNSDGIVDAADYTVWRDSIGQTGEGLAADGNGNGEVDAGDYDVWSLFFGESLIGGETAITSATTPEPAAEILFVVLAAGIVLAHRVRH